MLLREHGEVIPALSSRHHSVTPGTLVQSTFLSTKSSLDGPSFLLVPSFELDAAGAPFAGHTLSPSLHCCSLCSESSSFPSYLTRTHSLSGASS